MDTTNTLLLTYYTLGVATTVAAVTATHFTVAANTRARRNAELDRLAAETKILLEASKRSR